MTEKVMHGSTGGGWKRAIANGTGTWAPVSETPGMSALACSAAAPRQPPTLHGRFYRSAMEPLLLRVNFYVRRWAAKKYRRLRPHRAFQRWWVGLRHRLPRLFAQCQWVRAWWAT